MDDQKNIYPENTGGFRILTDEDLMPYGIHSDKKMKDVPAKYLLWLSDNDKCSRSVRAYITDNEDTIYKQAGRPLPKRGLSHCTHPRKMTRRL